jgi:prepilin-type N-terminal cleavage/methylation domain-containing protein
MVFTGQVMISAISEIKGLALKRLSTPLFMSSVESRNGGQTNAMKSYKHKKGVTLIELVIVVAVISLLATMVIGIASRIDERAKEKSLKNIFALLDGALQEYYEYTDKFPEQEEKNFANAATHSEYLYGQLHSIPSSRNVLEKISDSLFKNKLGGSDTPLEIYDPWGTAVDYRYTPDENFPELISAGPDKVFGTADDISSR